MDINININNISFNISISIRISININSNVNIININISLCFPKGEGLSLVPTLRTPPGEKRSGEQSQISWAYSPKWWKTNEIARSLIIT